MSWKILDVSAWLSVVWTSIFTIKIWSADFLFALIFVYITAAVLDFLTWTLASRKRKLILSSTNTNGLTKKALNLILVFFLLYLVWIITYYFPSADYLLIIPMMFIIGYIYWEIISIFENYSVIFEWTRDWIWYNLISYLTNKIFNLSIDKLKEVTQKKIDEKFNINNKKNDR